MLKAHRHRISLNRLFLTAFWTYRQEGALGGRYQAPGGAIPVVAKAG
jgi:hypothetical protein